MWIFTKTGFYSVVQNKDDPSLVHVRSQFRGDLERLQIGNKIIETPEADYRFRMDVLQVIWEYALQRMADDIDYTRFKPALEDKSTNRKEAYLSVFNTMVQAGRDEAFAEYKMREAKKDQCFFTKIKL